MLFQAQRGYRSEQLAGIGVARLAEQRSGAALLHHPAVLEHQDVVGQGAYHGEVVADEQVAQPLPAPRSLDLLLIPSALGLPFFSTGTITPLRPSPFHCTFYALCYELYGESCSHQCTFIAVGYRLGSNIRWNHRFLGR